jgi:hypothetical protein
MNNICDEILKIFNDIKKKDEKIFYNLSELN